MDLPLPPRVNCSVEGCDRSAALNRLCLRHYMRLWRAAEQCSHEGCAKQRWSTKTGLCQTHESWLKEGIPLDTPIVTRRVGCKRRGCKRKHYSRGLCHTHYMQAWRAGTIDQEEPSRQEVIAQQARQMG
jgi:hypothetical protein